MNTGVSVFDNHVFNSWGRDTAEHANLFYRLCLMTPVKNFLELGVCEGASSVLFAQIAKEIGGTAYGIDIQPCDAAVQKIKDLGLDSYWNFTIRDDRRRDECLKDFGLGLDARFGLIFFDTSKEPEHTRQEIELYAPMVCDGGFLLFHDVYLRDHWQAEIARPIIEFLEHSKEFKKYAVYRNCNGMLVAQKGKWSVN